MKDLGQAITRFLKYRFNLEEDKANEVEIVDTLKRSVEFRGTNLWALIFAILIASIGLNVNSTAVIIGAMLISPIMGPIMGIGLGAGTFDFKLIKYALKNLGLAVIIALLTSSLYFRLSPIQHAQSELLMRTSPTLWDVLIALFGGLAGIIAGTRKNISNTVPGVAIATALMPPLCTAGFGIASGNIYFFAGAFYLFIINSVFISLSTFLMVRFLKFAPVKFVDRRTESKVRRFIWGVALITIVPSLFLAYRFIQQEIFKQNLQAFVREEIEGRNLFVINQKVRPLRKEATFLIYSETNTDSVFEEISARKGFYQLTNAKIELRRTLNSAPGIADNTIGEDLNKRISEQTSIIIQKEKKIKQLENTVSALSVDDSLFYHEFRALFGEVKEISLSRVRVYMAGRVGNYLLLYVIQKGRVRNEAAILSWIKARYQTDSVRVIMNAR